MKGVEDVFLLWARECLKLGGVGDSTKVLYFSPDGFIGVELSIGSYLDIEKFLIFFIGKDVVDEFCEFRDGDSVKDCLGRGEGGRKVFGVL